MTDQPPNGYTAPMLDTTLFLTLLLKALAEDSSPEDPYVVKLDDRYVISVVQNPDGQIVASLVDAVAMTELVATVTADQLEVKPR